MAGKWGLRLAVGRNLDKYGKSLAQYEAVRDKNVCRNQTHANANKFKSASRPRRVHDESRMVGKDVSELDLVVTAG